jgi:hypothetical protein
MKNKKSFIVAVFFLGLFVTCVAMLPAKDDGEAKKKRPLGYQNTPIIPGTKWHVHDGERPQPVVVEPGKDASAPSDAIVIFDGKDFNKLKNKKWLLKDGYMEVAKGGQETLEKFGDMQLHVEWASPVVVRGTGQGRGNSGIFLMRRYEIQVLDCYKNQTYPDGQAASVYGQKPPLVNASRGPGQWQTYDIIFKAPRFGADKKLISPAYVTVIHNGVLVQNHYELLGPSRHKKNTSYKFHEAEDVITFQNHGNPVRYRNIWVRKLK